MHNKKRKHRMQKSISQSNNAQDEAEKQRLLRITLVMVDPR